MSRTSYIAVALAVGLIGCRAHEKVAAPVAAPADGNRVTTTGGVIEGSTLSSGVRVFLGVPFAAPPVGPLRWRPPQPLPRWEGVRPARAFGPAPMQRSVINGIIGTPSSQSEDCLHVNVWTPSRRAGEKLPVMVWIFGGAFVAGWTSQPLHDGQHLAERGVVVVSIGYRVGPFGFLAHPALTKEGQGASGNYGLLDQIAALAWIRDNAAAFGGDPGNVTIMGESAGAKAVSMLAASPPAKGLFHRAISQSGGSFGAVLTEREPGLQVRALADAEARGEKYLAKIGAPDLDAARALPAEKLLADPDGWWPIFDGRVLPKDQYELYLAKRFNDTPILVGFTGDDGASFIPPGMTPERFTAFVTKSFGAQANAVLAAYPHATRDEAVRASKDLARDTVFGWHTWAWARLQAERGTAPAFVYYFDHRLPKFPDGPPHGSTIAYVFGTFAHSTWSEDNPENRGVSDRIQRYWVSFARGGAPAVPGLPAWPAFTAASPRAMILDAQAPRAVELPNRTKLEVLDPYFTSRREGATRAPRRAVRAEPRRHERALPRRRAA